MLEQYAGTLLTALPSWAGTPELRGAPLALLCVLWLLGRVAFWASPQLPAATLALADLLLLPTLIALLAPGLWRARQRGYRWLLPLLLALLASNFAFHLAVANADAVLAERALRAAVWTLMLLFTVVGGLLTPIFTGNHLRARGQPGPGPVSWPLEGIAPVLLLGLAGVDLAGLPFQGPIAAACLIAHAWRVARWRGWRVTDDAVLAGMHLGFVWLLIALALKAAYAFGAPVPAAAWMHAFTVGALGCTMLGLMTRVALRHTGRPDQPPAMLPWVLGAVMLASALRLAGSVHGLPPWVFGLSAAFWAGAFGAYAWQFAPALLAPSVPRRTSRTT